MASEPRQSNAASACTAPRKGRYRAPKSPRNCCHALVQATCGGGQVGTASDSHEAGSQTLGRHPSAHPQGPVASA